ncbi:DEAD/DEAH box helicase [Serratia ureilytica]
MAQTGGKTAAFSLAAAQPVRQTWKAPQIVRVLAPTREPAVFRLPKMTDFSKHMNGVNVVALYGGQRYGRAAARSAPWPANRCGYPGRLLDHLEARYRNFQPERSGAG